MFMRFQSAPNGEAGLETTFFVVCLGSPARWPGGAVPKSNSVASGIIIRGIQAVLSHRTNGLVPNALALSCRPDLVEENLGFELGGFHRQAGGTTKTDRAGIG